MGLQSIGHNWATKHNQPVMNLGPTKVISIIIILIFNSYFYTRDWITKLLLVVTLGQSSVQFSSVTQSWRLFETPWAAAHQASLSITNSWSSLKLIPLSQWCHPAISSPVIPFSSCPQSLPASESFPVSQLFPSDYSIHSSRFWNQSTCFEFWLCHLLWLQASFWTSLWSSF